MKLNSTSHADLLYAAAMMTCKGEIDIPRITAIGHELLNSGVYFDEIIDVIYFPIKPMHSDMFYEPLTKFLQKLKIPLFTDMSAIKDYLIFYFLRRIAYLKLDPVIEADSLFYNIAFFDEWYYSAEFDQICGMRSVYIDTFHSGYYPLNAKDKSYLANLIFKEANKYFRIWQKKYAHVDCLLII